MRKKPELLIPASSLEVLKIAVIYGADAVYIGGEVFGLRAKARNFSMKDMAEGIAFAHRYGVKVYVTANILAHNRDLEGVREYFEELKEIKPDALIISDPGIFMIAKEVCPEIEQAADKMVLMAALNILKEDERELVLLHATAGMKHREIAAALGIPLATALSKYNRAMKKMENYLTK